MSRIKFLLAKSLMKKVLIFSFIFNGLLAYIFNKPIWIVPKRHLCNKRYRDDIGSTTNAVHYPQYNAFRCYKGYNIHIICAYTHYIVHVHVWVVIPKVVQDTVDALVTQFRSVFIQSHRFKRFAAIFLLIISLFHWQWIIVQIDLPKIDPSEVQTVLHWPCASWTHPWIDLE